MRAQQAEPAPNITPKMVDWILYNMPVLRDQVDAIEPRSSTSVVALNRQSIFHAGYEVFKVWPRDW